MRDILYDRFQENFRKSIGGHTLIDWGKVLASADEKAFEVEHTGNLFKLYSLYSYLNFPYLHIMPNQRRMAISPFKLIYLDLFSGNGLNRIETNGRKYFVCGSPILALLASFLRSQRREYSCDFDHMIMIDQKDENISLLSERLKLVASQLGIDSTISISNNVGNSKANVIVAKGDVTDDKFVQELTDSMDEIWGNDLVHVMLFVDPDSPRGLKMKTLKKMLSYPGDLLILLHPGIFSEMTMKKRYNAESLMSMLDIGESEARSLLTTKQTPSKLADYYVGEYENAIRNTSIRRLRDGTNRRNVVVKVPIRTKQFSYLLIYATRQTSGNSSSWQKPFEDFANWIGRQSDTGELALLVLTGRQSRFEDFTS